VAARLRAEPVCPDEADVQHDDPAQHRERVLDPEEAQGRLPERGAWIGERRVRERAQRVEREPEQELHVDQPEPRARELRVGLGEGAAAPVRERGVHDHRHAHAEDEPAQPGVGEERERVDPVDRHGTG
jgi:hypothetical protein